MICQVLCPGNYLPLLLGVDVAAVQTGLLTAAFPAAGEPGKCCCHGDRQPIKFCRGLPFVAGVGKGKLTAADGFDI